jgi:hypothetical protein
LLLFQIQKDEEVQFGVGIGGMRKSVTDEMLLMQGILQLNRGGERFIKMEVANVGVDDEDAEDGEDAEEGEDAEDNE